ncbi:Transcription factor-like protein DPB [Apostasia shenzhenica]|uniref:Transcription factor-like protein DPB n=1 Tax=Apostasia shenzhenica TaxID=1088818 RepID=A0A2H9ZR16_9ASPA|nr:Transcription factor-like protein DPB [Apostasia shenzhenica]
MEADRCTGLESEIDKEEIRTANHTHSLGENGNALVPTPCDGILKLNDACAEDGNYVVPESADRNRKKVSRIVGWGLRRFSKIVCQKVQAKGRTTYNEVADEIIADLATLDKASEFEFDEKNIRRRVYDAFNVLLAINVIIKDKKEIRWMGFPNTSTKSLEDLKKERMNLMIKIQEKTNYLKELEAKATDLRNLVQRNQHLCGSGKGSSEGVALPFLLVQTNPEATVEIEISSDMQLVHFDFNGTPFSLHDEAAVLKMMRCPHSTPANLFTHSRTPASKCIKDEGGKLIRPPSFSWSSESLTM